MNSTVAIDALVLGVPALVVGLPNNLSPFVEAGAMLGADGARRDPAGSCEALLYDREVRRARCWPPAPRSPTIRAGLRRPGGRAIGGGDSGRAGSRAGVA